MKHILGPSSRSSLTNVREGDVQPNAIDLRLGKVFRILTDTFVLSEDFKQHRGTEPIIPNLLDNYLLLSPGHYEVVMENIINVGANEAGWVITRSTLNRNGVFLTSGLYDSGYNGAMAAVMHVTCGMMKIMPGTRIGQYISFDAEMLHKYNGSYGFKQDGTPKEEEKKYHGNNSGN